MRLLADSLDNVFGTISPPPQIAPFTKGTGAEGLTVFFTNIIAIIYVIAGLVFLFMIIMAAIQWIVSGGEKEAIAKARARITHAIIGIVLLALAGVILNTVGLITGFKFIGTPAGLSSEDPCRKVIGQPPPC